MKKFQYLLWSTDRKVDTYLKKKKIFCFLSGQKHNFKLLNMSFINLRVDSEMKIILSEQEIPDLPPPREEMSWSIK